MMPWIAILAASLQAQAADGPKVDENLAYMKSVLAPYRLAREGDRPGPLAPGPEPAFRMGKQAAFDMTDGAIFLWTGDGGRPEAAAQVYQIKNRPGPGTHWALELVSLSTTTLAADRDGKPTWSPRRPGVEFKAVPDAPKPSDNPAERSRQMKALAREFKLSDDFRSRGWSELRLLPTPLARYGEDGSGVLEGWLLAYAQGTDLEAFLLLEAREATNGPEWHYAFAPMTCFALKATREGKVAWEVPRRPLNDPTRPFFGLFDLPPGGKTPEEAPR